MKTINNFYDNAKFWKIIVFHYILFFWIFIGIAELSFDKSFVVPLTIKIGAVIAFFMSLMTSSLVWLSRQSMKFWDEARVLRESVETINDIDGLNRLCNNDLVHLNKIAGGGPHCSEVISIKDIIDTKIKMIKLFNK